MPLSQALVLAERLIDGERPNADCVEVTHLKSDHHELEHSSSLSVAPANTRGAASRDERAVIWIALRATNRRLRDHISARVL